MPNPVIGATYSHVFEQKVAHEGVLSSTSLMSGRASIAVNLRVSNKRCSACLLFSRTTSLLVASRQIQYTVGLGSGCLSESVSDFEGIGEPG